MLQKTPKIMSKTDYLMDASVYAQAYSVCIVLRVLAYLWSMQRGTSFSFMNFNAVLFAGNESSVLKFFYYSNLNCHAEES